LLYFPVSTNYDFQVRVASSRQLRRNFLGVRALLLISEGLRSIASCFELLRLSHTMLAVSTCRGPV